jgi:hypothetical protein
MAMNGIFVVVCLDREVTVLRPPTLVHVFAVLESGNVERKRGNCTQEFTELFEEGSGEVKVAPVFEGIPRVTVPHFMVIDLVRMIRWEDRKHLLPCEVTLPEVQVALDSPCEPALQPAFGTQGRSRHLHLCVEALIAVIDQEGALTLPTLP